MNIFYYSVHQILEDDEIRLFQEMGHNVFCLGINRKEGAIQNFRPSVKFNPIEEHMFDDYVSRGGTYAQNGELNNIVPNGFEGHFSIFIVMHDITFIQRFWNRLKDKKVVWRTIGQGVDAFDAALSTMRRDGLKIIRYSPIETGFQGCLGQDALIRFYKDPEQYCDWTGHVEKVLIFSNMFAQRYPIEAESYKSIASLIPCALGGGNNESLPGAFGFLSFENQIVAYRSYRAYLYMTGMDIPYTLNFIEAWMTGVPVVVLAPLDRTGAFFEIDQLIEDGVSGFVCRTSEQAVDRCKALLANHELATRIGSAGRAAAIAYFGKEQIRSQWEKFFVEH